MVKSSILLLLILAFVFNANAQFSYVTDLDPAYSYKNTGEKPQSKVWKHDGIWWAVFPITSGTYIWRLDGTTWTNMLKISTSKPTKADCKNIGNTAHIFLFRNEPKDSELISLEYIPSLHTYQRWTRRPTTTSLYLEVGVETATIDVDSNERMWVASDGTTEAFVRWSDPPYTTWSAPITVATGITDDDITAIIAMPQLGKVGVLWSNQNTKRFGFKTHDDGASPSNWSADEVPASQSALDVGHGMCDDHLNMAAATDGTVYCAVKTGYDTPGYPLVSLLVRRPSGTWDNLYEVSQSGTRPIVLLSETLGKLSVVYTSVEDGGDILYQESATSPISFGPARVLISGVYNNSTSSKDNYSSDIVILASTGGNNSDIVGVLASNAPPPPPPGIPTLASPDNASTDIEINPTLSWNATTNATSYQLQVSTLADFATTSFDQNDLSSTSALVTGLASDTKFYWRVRALNGLVSGEWSSVWSFTTIGTSTNNSLIAYWKMDESSGTALLDNSTYDNKGVTTGNPLRVDGISGMALQLNGNDQYAVVPDHNSLDISSSITLAAWIKPEKWASQDIIKKGLSKETDGYELSLTSTGKVTFKFNEVSSSTLKLNSRTRYPSDGNTWMHIAATYDGATIKLYINGNLDKSETLSAPPPININNVDLGIGAQSNGSSRFQGTLDEVQVYNTALSDSEVLSLASVSSSNNARMMGESKHPQINNSSLMVQEASNIMLNEPYEDIFSLVKTYPNPTHHILYLEFYYKAEKNTSVAIVDQMGRVRFQKYMNKDDEKLEINLSSLHISSGTYQLLINSPQVNKSVQFIKN